MRELPGEADVAVRKATEVSAAALSVSKMVASTHSLDDLSRVSQQPASPSQQQQAHHHPHQNHHRHQNHQPYQHSGSGQTHGTSSCKTAEDKRSRLSNVIANLRKKVPSTAPPQQQQQPQEAKKSQIASVDDICTTMTVLNGPEPVPVTDQHKESSKLDVAAAAPSSTKDESGSNKPDAVVATMQPDQSAEVKGTELQQETTPQESSEAQPEEEINEVCKSVVRDILDRLVEESDTKVMPHSFKSSPEAESKEEKKTVPVASNGPVSPKSTTTTTTSPCTVAKTGVTVADPKKITATALRASLHCSIPLTKVEASSFSKQLMNAQKAVRRPVALSRLSPAAVQKILCLYCDRNFATISVRQRHTERMHRCASSTTGRRSERTSRHSHGSSVGSRAASNKAQQRQTCLHCSEQKSSNLEGLFKHMVGSHSDKYHGCLVCSTRYASRDALTRHVSESHAKQQQEEEASSNQFDKAFYRRIVGNIQENLSHFIDGRLQTKDSNQQRQSATTTTATTTTTSAADERPLRTANESSGGGSPRYDQLPIDISLTAAAPVYERDYRPIDADENSSENADKPGVSNTAKQLHRRRLSFEKFNFPRKYDGKGQSTSPNEDLDRFDLATQLKLRRRQKLAGISTDSDDSKDDASAAMEQFHTHWFGRSVVIGGNESKFSGGDFQWTTSDVSETKIKLNSTDTTDRESKTSGRDFSSSSTENSDRVVESVQVQCDSAVNVSIEPPTVFSSEFQSFMKVHSGPPGSNVKKNIEEDKPIHAELSGEWSRPRIYICEACADKYVTLKELEEHKQMAHPNVWCSHYEFSGDQRELYKHLVFLPQPSVNNPLNTSQIRTRQQSTLSEKVCTKCHKQYAILAELHRHMLECGGDQVWLSGLFGNSKKKNKWRPFGSRRRRRGMKRNIENSQAPKSPRMKRPRDHNAPRVRPSDRESIQKMLANLPAKRITRTVLQGSSARSQGRLRNTQSMSGTDNSADRISRSKAALRNKLLKNAKSFQRKKNLREEKQLARDEEDRAEEDEDSTEQEKVEENTEIKSSRLRASTSKNTSLPQLRVTTGRLRNTTVEKTRMKLMTSDKKRKLNNIDLSQLSQNALKAKLQHRTVDGKFAKPDATSINTRRPTNDPARQLTRSKLRTAAKLAWKTHTSIQRTTRLSAANANAALSKLGSKKSARTTSTSRRSLEEDANKNEKPDEESRPVSRSRRSKRESTGEAGASDNTSVPEEAKVRSLRRTSGVETEPKTRRSLAEALKKTAKIILEPVPITSDEGEISLGRRRSISKVTKAKEVQEIVTDKKSANDSTAKKDSKRSQKKNSNKKAVNETIESDASLNEVALQLKLETTPVKRKSLRIKDSEAKAVAVDSVDNSENVKKSSEDETIKSAPSKKKKQAAKSTEYEPPISGTPLKACPVQPKHPAQIKIDFGPAPESVIEAPVTTENIAQIAAPEVIDATTAEETNIAVASVNEAILTVEKSLQNSNIEHLLLESSNSNMDSGKENSTDAILKSKVAKPKKIKGSRGKVVGATKRSLSSVIGILTEGVNVPMEKIDTTINVLTVQTSIGMDANNTENACQSSGTLTVESSSGESTSKAAEANVPAPPALVQANSAKVEKPVSETKVEETPVTLKSTEISAVEDKSNLPTSSRPLQNVLEKISSPIVADQPANDIILDLTRRKCKGKGSFLEKIVSKIAKQKDVLLDGEGSCLDLTSRRNSDNTNVQTSNSTKTVETAKTEISFYRNTTVNLDNSLIVNKSVNNLESTVAPDIGEQNSLVNKASSNKNEYSKVTEKTLDKSNTIKVDTQKLEKELDINKSVNIIEPSIAVENLRNTKETCGAIEKIDSVVSTVKLETTINTKSETSADIQKTDEQSLENVLPQKDTILNIPNVIEQKKEEELITQINTPIIDSTKSSEATEKLDEVSKEIKSGRRKIHNSLTDSAISTTLDSILATLEKSNKSVKVTKKSNGKTTARKKKTDKVIQSENASNENISLVSVEKSLNVSIDLSVDNKIEKDIDNRESAITLGPNTNITEQNSDKAETTTTSPDEIVSSVTEPSLKIESAAQPSETVIVEKANVQNQTENKNVHKSKKGKSKKAKKNEQPIVAKNESSKAQLSKSAKKNSKNEKSMLESSPIVSQVAEESFKIPETSEVPKASSKRQKALYIPSDSESEISESDQTDISISSNGSTYHPLSESEDEIVPKRTSKRCSQRIKQNTKSTTLNASIKETDFEPSELTTSTPRRSRRNVSSDVSRDASVSSVDDITFEDTIPKQAENKKSKKATSTLIESSSEILPSDEAAKVDLIESETAAAENTENIKNKKLNNKKIKKINSDADDLSDSTLISKTSVSESAPEKRTSLRKKNEQVKLTSTVDASDSSNEITNIKEKTRSSQRTKKNVTIAEDVTVRDEVTQNSEMITENSINVDNEINLSKKVKKSVTLADEHTVIPSDKETIPDSSVNEENIIKKRSSSRKSKTINSQDGTEKLNDNVLEDVKSDNSGDIRKNVKIISDNKSDEKLNKRVSNKKSKKSETSLTKSTDDLSSTSKAETQKITEVKSVVNDKNNAKKSIPKQTSKKNVSLADERLELLSDNVIPAIPEAQHQKASLNIESARESLVKEPVIEHKRNNKTKEERKIVPLNEFLELIGNAHIMKKPDPKNDNNIKNNKKPEPQVKYLDKVNDQKQKFKKPETAIAEVAKKVSDSSKNKKRDSKKKDKKKSPLVDEPVKPFSKTSDNLVSTASDNLNKLDSSENDTSKESKPILKKKSKKSAILTEDQIEIPSARGVPAEPELEAVVGVVAESVSKSLKQEASGEPNKAAKDTIYTERKLETQELPQENDNNIQGKSKDLIVDKLLVQIKKNDENTTISDKEKENTVLDKSASSEKQIDNSDNAKSIAQDTTLANKKDTNDYSLGTKSSKVLVNAKKPKLTKEEQKYLCDVCNTLFTRRSSLNKHNTTQSHMLKLRQNNANNSSKIDTTINSDDTNNKQKELSSADDSDYGESSKKINEDEPVSLIKNVADEQPINLATKIDLSEPVNLCIDSNKRKVCTEEKVKIDTDNAVIPLSEVKLPLKSPEEELEDEMLDEEICKITENMSHEEYVLTDHVSPVGTPAASLPVEEEKIETSKNTSQKKSKKNKKNKHHVEKLVELDTSSNQTRVDDSTSMVDESSNANEAIESDTENKKKTRSKRSRDDEEVSTVTAETKRACRSGINSNVTQPENCRPRRNRTRPSYKEDDDDDDFTKSWKSDKDKVKVAETVSTSSEKESTPKNANDVASSSTEIDKPQSSKKSTKKSKPDTSELDPVLPASNSVNSEVPREENTIEAKSAVVEDNLTPEVNRQSSLKPKKSQNKRKPHVKSSHKRSDEKPETPAAVSLAEQEINIPPIVTKLAITPSKIDLSNVNEKTASESCNEHQAAPSMLTDFDSDENSLDTNMSMDIQKLIDDPEMTSEIACSKEPAAISSQSASVDVMNFEKPRDSTSEIIESAKDTSISDETGANEKKHLSKKSHRKKRKETKIRAETTTSDVSDTEDVSMIEKNERRERSKNKIVASVFGRTGEKVKEVPSSRQTRPENNSSSDSESDESYVAHRSRRVLKRKRSETTSRSRQSKLRAEELISKAFIDDDVPAPVDERKLKRTTRTLSKEKINETSTLESTPDTSKKSNSSWNLSGRRVFTDYANNDGQSSSSSDEEEPEIKPKYRKTSSHVNFENEASSAANVAEDNTSDANEADQQPNPSSTVSKNDADLLYECYTMFVRPDVSNTHNDQVKAVPFANLLLSVDKLLGEPDNEVRDRAYNYKHRQNQRRSLNMIENSAHGSDYQKENDDSLDVAFEYNIKLRDEIELRMREGDGQNLLAASSSFKSNEQEYESDQSDRGNDQPKPEMSCSISLLAEVACAQASESNTPTVFDRPLNDSPNQRISNANVSVEHNKGHQPDNQDGEARSFGAIEKSRHDGKITNKGRNIPLIRSSQFQGGMAERRKRLDILKNKSWNEHDKSTKDVYDFDEDSASGTEPSSLRVSDLVSRTIDNTLSNASNVQAYSNNLQSLIDDKFRNAELVRNELAKSEAIDHKKVIERRKKRPSGEQPNSSSRNSNKSNNKRKSGKSAKKKSRNAWYENDSSDEYVTKLKADDIGVGISKSQRTCSKGKQNLFAEMSSTSSESEPEQLEDNLDDQRIKTKKSTTSNTTKKRDRSKTSKKTILPENQTMAKNWEDGDDVNKTASSALDLDSCKKSESELSDHPLVIDESHREINETELRTNSDAETEERAVELDDWYREDSSVPDSENENLTEEKSDKLISENKNTNSEQYISVEDALKILDLQQEESKKPKNKRSSPKENKKKMKKSPVLPEKQSNSEKGDLENLPLHVFLNRKVQESKKRKEVKNQKREQNLSEEEQAHEEQSPPEIPPARRQRKCAVGKQGLLAEISSSDDESDREYHRSHGKARLRESREKRKERSIEKKHELMFAKEQKAIEESIMRELEEKRLSAASEASGTDDYKEDKKEQAQAKDTAKSSPAKKTPQPKPKLEETDDSLKQASSTQKKRKAASNKSSKSKSTKEPKISSIKETQSDKEFKDEDDELKAKRSWNNVDADVGIAIGRRKRVATRQLYYWSTTSSSDDEKAEATSTAVSVAPDVPAPDVGPEDECPEQHGWIVGHSHKQMITMLAMEKQMKEKRRRSEDEDQALNLSTQSATTSLMVPVADTATASSFSPSGGNATSANKSVKAKKHRSSAN
ncbi:uncharacterized protein LOC106652567 isoform X2 [Trichogramma pretiosum]|uniref:uncharacterized protein LOC106652567 isoform X2 n=1 Tax=Trichogramma pretiosum TaxID=7493 RepID=UPI0006C97161|nr:uncharacterized protein LOC106652567 isoform X2 [Trichogramma pretiosum]